MSIPTPEMIVKINEWRAKIAANTLTIEEQRDIIRYMRESRGKTVQTSAGSAVNKRTKAAAAKPDGDSLLGELEGL